MKRVKFYIKLWVLFFSLLLTPYFLILSFAAEENPTAEELQQIEAQLQSLSASLGKMPEPPEIKNKVIQLPLSGDLPEKNESQREKKDQS
jgi:hypothetical protein